MKSTHGVVSFFLPSRHRGQGSNFRQLPKSCPSNKPEFARSRSRAAFQFGRYLASERVRERESVGWPRCEHFIQSATQLSDVFKTAPRVGGVFGLRRTVFLHLVSPVFAINKHLATIKIKTSTRFSHKRVCYTWTQGSPLKDILVLGWNETML